MDSNSFLYEFKCAVSPKAHYIIKPISLKCGHYACGLCVSMNESIIKCLNCNNSTNIESTEVKISLDNYMENLFSSMKYLYQNTIDEFNGKLYIFLVKTNK